MDEREQQRKVRHRLAVLRHAEEVTGNVAATCRYYGISRQCFYKWKRRYGELGEAGLRDGSGAPLHSPNQTNAEVVGKIVYLRSNYHFGPHKISAREERHENDRDTVTDVVSGDGGRHDLGHGEPVAASEAQGVGLALGSLGLGLPVGAPGVPP